MIFFDEYCPEKNGGTTVLCHTLDLCYTPYIALAKIMQHMYRKLQIFIIQ